jgi:hypothetical protein
VLFCHLGGFCRIKYSEVPLQKGLSPFFVTLTPTITLLFYFARFAKETVSTKHIVHFAIASYLSLPNNTAFVTIRSLIIRLYQFIGRISTKKL